MMGKGNISRFKWKANNPRQTRWSRKKRKIKNASQIATPVRTNSFDLFDDDLDCVSITGDVPGELEWDVSSVSSVGSRDNLVLSDSDEYCEISSDEDFDFVEQINDVLHADIQLSLAESLHLVLAFSRRANLSKKLTEDLLKLIKLHLPKSVTYPVTYFRFEKALGISQIKCENFAYCENQHVITNGRCNECDEAFDENMLIKQGKYFVIYDVRSQMEIMLKNKNIKNHLTTSILNREKMTKSEIVNTYGSKYYETVLNWNISATFNTDGVPVFKSSKLSIWPCLLALDELPYGIRKRNIILSALWSGSSKINSKLVFSKLVPVLNKLYEDGIIWENSLGDLCSSKVLIQKCSVDAVARCIIQGLTQFNGAYGCSHCKEQGTVVPKGRGRCRVFQNIDNLELRTEAEHRSLIESSDYKYGIKCATPLLGLQNFNVIDGVVIEPMHNLFLGIGKTITQLWFTLKNSDCYLGKAEVREIISNRLKSCKVPSEIVRTVRGLDLQKHWKASEYRTMTFILSVITKDLLPKSYHKNFCKFANSVYLLSLPCCTTKQIDCAEKYLKSFVKNVANLYGEEFMSYNMHCLLHLCQSCRNWGPLWQFSAFIFESFNAVLLKYISNANGVSAQISKRFNFETSIRYKALSFFKNEYAMTLFSSLARVPQFVPNMFYIKQPYKIFNCNDVILEKCAEFASVRCIFSSKSAIINGHLFKQRETEKRADCYIKISDFEIGTVKNFLHIECCCELACNCRKDLVIVEVFKVSKLGFSEFAFQCSSSVRKQVKVMDIKNLSCDKFFTMKYNDTLFFLHVCNLFEID